jgi:hypothetical protein
MAIGRPKAAILKKARRKRGARGLSCRLLATSATNVVRVLPIIATSAAGNGPNRRRVAKLIAEDIEKTICGTKPTLVVNSAIMTKIMNGRMSGKDAGRLVRDQRKRAIPNPDKQTV